MIKTRPLVSDDLDEIRQLHEKHFEPYFGLPDFTRMLCAFIITDENDKTIMAGGVQPIGEILLVTDKKHPSKTELGRALVEAQNISRYVCEKTNIDQMAAFVQDEQYARHLIKHGFYPRVGQALAMKV